MNIKPFNIVIFDYYFVDVGGTTRTFNKSSRIVNSENFSKKKMNSLHCIHNKINFYLFF